MATRSRRVSVPSVADMMRKEGFRTVGTKFERERISTAVQKNAAPAAGDGPKSAGMAARASAAYSMTYDLALAMQAAKEGDTSELLPYQPTNSINPPRPRTHAAGYDPTTRVMRVMFRDGAIYGYADVSPNEWRNFKRVKSPGRSINRNFNMNQHAYWREPWT